MGTFCVESEAGVEVDGRPDHIQRVPTTHTTRQIPHNSQYIAFSSAITNLIRSFSLIHVSPSNNVDL